MGNNVSGLLEAAVGGWLAERVTKAEPRYASADMDATTKQAWMDGQQKELHDLIQWVESPESIPFRPGFDAHDYDLSISTPDGKRSSDRDASNARPEFLSRKGKGAVSGHLATTKNSLSISPTQ